MSILDKIVAHKKNELPNLKAKYGYSFNHKSKRSFIKRMKANRYISCITEIKRGSPSKGPFALDLDIVKQAEFYEKNGADCISVLVDETFFYGSYDFIPKIRNATKLPILFKEFIIDIYQIDLASHLGADVILLIERILTSQELKSYIEYAHNIGLEVLVEVDSEKAIERTKDLDFKLLGINNRDLSDFSIDLSKTNTLKAIANKYGKLVVSESGIHSRSDILKIREKVEAILVGESIVKSQEILKEFRVLKNPLKVKICGLQDKETIIAIDGTCDYIGLVFAKSKRQVSIDQALGLRKHVKQSKLVGVFKNQAPEEIIQTKLIVDLDMVQSHDQLELPFEKNDIIYAKKYNELEIDYDGYILVDNINPGSGETYPLDNIEINHNTDYILAGGLTCDNVVSRVHQFPCTCVDISSGVETDGKKDIAKIREFIKKVSIL